MLFRRSKTKKIYYRPDYLIDQSGALTKKRFSVKLKVFAGLVGVLMLAGATVYALPQTRPTSVATKVKAVNKTVQPVAKPVAQVAAPTPPTPPAPAPVTTPAAKPTPAPAPAPTPPPSGPCSSNTDSQLLLVNLGQQHMWACSHNQQVYDTAITSGAYQIDGDATPTGTWHIYSKETNRYLVGPGYRDYVQYWMPFYTDYGFHDASWQTFPFGSPDYASQGSHGCVHLPTPAAAWVYNWAPIGTTVTIQS